MAGMISSNEGRTGVPQPSHVTLRVEYDDGAVHEFSADRPEKVRLDVTFPPGAFAVAKDALRENPYLIPKAVDRTRRVDIGFEAAEAEEVRIRDSRVTIAARQALDAFRLATGWSDEQAVAYAEARKQMPAVRP
jgi:hypothetical protein